MIIEILFCKVRNDIYLFSLNIHGSFLKIIHIFYTSIAK